MKKIRKITLGIVLSCISIFTLFGVAGCGSVSLSTLSTNFEKLDECYADNSDVFVGNYKNGDYSISYGDIVDNYIKIAKLVKETNALSSEVLEENDDQDTSGQATYYFYLESPVYYNQITEPTLPTTVSISEDNYTRNTTIATYTVIYSNVTYNSPTGENSIRVETSSISVNVTAEIKSILPGYRFYCWAVMTVVEDSENSYSYEVKSYDPSATFDITCTTSSDKIYNYIIPVFYLGNDETDYSDYLELETLYNETLSMALEYVDSNRSYVLGLDEDTMSSSTKSAIKTLNSSLTSYIDSIEDFVSALNTMKNYFTRHSNSDSEAVVLQRFKQSYGEMVSKAVTLSVSMEEVIASSGIYEMLTKVEPADQDAETIKDYICAKLLPVFSEFKISEVASVMKWSSTKDGDSKERLQTLMDALDENFEIYKTLASTIANRLDSEGINQLFEYAEKFFVEMDDYFEALYDLDLRSLSVTYENNLENYLSENAFAEIYLKKLEQFVNKTLPDFMAKVMEIITTTNV